MADWSSILQGILGGARDIAGVAGPWYAANRSADNMEHQAGAYRQLGIDAANRASPISNERRGQWDQRLSQLYENPQAFLEGNPEYKANLSLGTGELAAQNAARGHNLGGKATTDQLKFLTELSSKYIGKERDDLMSMAGYQFDPANSARYLMEGGQLAQQAEIAALAARLAPLGMLGRGNPGGGPPGSDGGGGSPFSFLQRLLGGAGGGGGGGGGGLGGGSSPLDLISILNKLPLGSLSPDMFDQLGQGGGIGALFEGLNPQQLEGIFGPGYESFLTQNPDWLSQGGEIPWLTGGFNPDGSGFGFDLGGDFSFDNFDFDAWLGG